MGEPGPGASGPGRDSLPPPALEVVGIRKRFGPVAANDGASIAVPKGTIHGIVGENGAGKSTLMGIVYGYHRADRGEIRIDGNAVAVGSPDKAIALGIGMVHQHFMLVDTFTVLENVVLGAEHGLLLRRGLAAARREVLGLGRDHGLEVDPDAIVGDLPVGLRQRVEILKALYRGAGILILDEPTAVLTPQEADDLFRILRMLRDRGRTIILITHKLREIMEVTDRVSVMRAGRVVGEVDTAATDGAALAGMMVGRDVPVPAGRRGTRPGRAVLEVEGLEVRDGDGTVRVRDAGFVVRAGEVVGVAGVAGNGQSELLEAVAGMRPAHRGTIRINGRTPRRRGMEDAARAMRRLGLAHVPEDRQRMGLVTEFDASENCILGRHRDRFYNRGPWLSRRAAIEEAGRTMARFDVRPPLPTLAAARFSGGNQQKIVVGREISRSPDVLLAGQPTRGVDIGAMAFIHGEIAAMRDAGAAVLLVSVELEEIMTLSDRILVMLGGRIVGEVPAASDVRTIGLMMTGGAPAGAGGSRG